MIYSTCLNIWPNHGDPLDEAVRVLAKLWWLNCVTGCNEIKSNDLFLQNKTKFTIISILVWLHVSVPS